MTAPTRDGLCAMKRPQLQRLCKQHRLRGNLKTSELVDLLVSHFEKQNASDHSPASTAPSPPASLTHSQDENRQPSTRHSSVFLELPVPTPDKLDLTFPNSPQLPTSNPSPSTSSRLGSLESFCARLLSQISSATTTITSLQSRLEAAEQSVSHLTSQLEEAQSQIRGLQTVKSDVRDLKSSFVDFRSFKQHTETVGTRLSQAEADLAHLRIVGSPNRDDNMLFEPPTRARSSSVSLSRRSKSREVPGHTSSWAQSQLETATGLPAVRLFGAGMGDDMDCDDRPSSSSSRGRLFPGALPIKDDRSVGSGTAVAGSLSSGVSLSSRKSTSVEPFLKHGLAIASSSRDSSRPANGKRPASPPPAFPPSDADQHRAPKRARRNGPEDSPLNSESISTADSPLFPPSPMMEPSTPPNRSRPLLPPVEIVSTPSPRMSEYHGFATTPRPPVEHPNSPTESPRRIMARRFKIDTHPPVPTFPSTEPSDRRKSHRFSRTSVDFGGGSMKGGPSSPAPLLIGKGKVLRASLDPETAYRSPSEEAEAGPSRPGLMSPPLPRTVVFFPPLAGPSKLRAISPPPHTLALPPPLPPLAFSSNRRPNAAPLLTAASPLPEPAIPRNYAADPDEVPPFPGRMNSTDPPRSFWNKAWGR